MGSARAEGLNTKGAGEANSKIRRARGRQNGGKHQQGSQEATSQKLKNEPAANHKRQGKWNEKNKSHGGCHAGILDHLYQYGPRWCRSAPHLLTMHEYG